MTSSDPSQKELPKGNVLLADDDTSERTALDSFFSESGCKCDVVESAAGLFKALASDQYDIVVTNLHMPGISGLELLSQIQASKKQAAVIVVSDGKNFEGGASALQEEGVLDFIEKPIDYSILASALKRVLGALDQKRYSDTFICEMAPVSTDVTMPSSEFVQKEAKLEIAEQLFKSGKVDLHTSLKLDLAFQEAVANALEHGNLELESVWKEEFDEEGLDKFSKLRKERLANPSYGDRTVRIKITYKDSFLEVSVYDQGNGFLPEAAADNDSGEIRLHGRGLMIMNSVMDDVVYRDCGRQVILRKKVAS